MILTKIKGKVIKRKFSALQNPKPNLLLYLHFPSVLILLCFWALVVYLDGRHLRKLALLLSLVLTLCYEIIAAEWWDNVCMANLFFLCIDIACIVFLKLLSSGLQLLVQNLIILEAFWCVGSFLLWLIFRPSYLRE